MSNKIGRFEILSELATSPKGCVYKASDPESGQTVALKTLKLEEFGEHATTVAQSILDETEKSKSLNSPNIALLYGAGDVDGQFFAAMEYIQGNSIATMLARKEGFSIWDLMDVARQTSQGLDHAFVHQVVHYSLEPAKIMVQWDGTVKILGFGTSLMGAHAAQASGPAPEILHYMSPEQLRGDPVDARSNLFSLGTILYEMVTERKAFDGDDAEQVRQSILEMTPVAPDQINRKLHPALSEVIIKAISKNPEARYGSGQELVNDLERCKESTTKTPAKKTVQPQGVPAAKREPASPSAPVSAKPPKPVVSAPPAAPKVQAAMPVATPAAAKRVPPSAPAPPVAERKAAAAAAGWGGNAPASTQSEAAPVHEFSVAAEVEAASTGGERMSSATVEPEVEAPRINVDPAMMEPKSTGGPASRSFSEIDELPPLKELYVAPPAPPTPPQPSQEAPPETLFVAAPQSEKPKVQPREVARKAVTEIKKTPPKLFMYAIAGAIGFILLIVVAIAFHIHNENSDEDSGPAQPQANAAVQPTMPDRQAPVPTQATAPAPVPVQAIEPAPSPAEPAISVTSKYNKKKAAKNASPSQPMIVPGQLSVNSAPEGAQVTMDGHSDANWQTPYNLTNISPGQHNITVSKPGFSSETRTIEVGSGSKSFLSIQLVQMAAAISLASEPSAASIFIDGKDTGRVTPAQISVDKPGNHTFQLKKAGYLEESTTMNLQAGQVLHYAPALKALGSTDDIRTVSKFKKVFGGGDASGQGTVSIKTNPKGAQVAINHRILEKTSPVEFYLNPGTYVIDITMSGFKDLHRVVNVEKGNKIAMDEALERQ